MRVLKRRILMALIKGHVIPDLSGEKTFLNKQEVSAGRLIWSADGALLQGVGDGEFVILEGY